MNRNLLFLTLLCACSAHAQTVQKCSGQGGTTAYRSGDCLPGERLVAVRDAAPRSHIQVQTEPPHTQQPHEAHRAKHASNNGVTTRQHRRDIARRSERHLKPTRDPCSAAKQARDDFQRKRSIRITMAQLSRWNHRVYDACK